MSLQRSPMPPRRQPLARTAGLARSAPLDRSSVLERRAPLRPVSAKRAAQNRVRRTMIAALYPDRPLCFVPWCPRWADDVHAPLTRARGGSITDPDNQKPLCREHHDEITFTPESALGWAYELGLLIHSWDAPAADGGEAA
jgi:hypothetical protein